MQGNQNRAVQGNNNIVNQGDNNTQNILIINEKLVKQVAITAEDFFRPLLNAENRLNHTWSLVGRTKSVEELHKFVQSDQQRIGILTGRGGIGKTKLLHTFAQQFDEHHQQFSLRFLMQEAPITIESLEELPIEPCVIVSRSQSFLEVLPHGDFSKTLLHWESTF